jgi:hypothetical protein
MGLLSLDRLIEGMVLESEVHDRSGRLLLGCGVELNAKHLRMFRMWGIAEANIVGVDDQGGNAPPAADVDSARQSKVEKELRTLFCNTDLSYTAMGELFRICLHRKVRNESR